jgi:hypothetical protein
LVAWTKKVMKCNRYFISILKNNINPPSKKNKNVCFILQSVDVREKNVRVALVYVNIAVLLINTKTE